MTPIDALKAKGKTLNLILEAIRSHCSEIWARIYQASQSAILVLSAENS